MKMKELVNTRFVLSLSTMTEVFGLTFWNSDIMHIFNSVGTHLYRGE